MQSTLAVSRNSRISNVLRRCVCGGGVAGFACVWAGGHMVATSPPHDACAPSPPPTHTHPHTHLHTCAAHLVPRSGVLYIHLHKADNLHSRLHEGFTRNM